MHANSTNAVTASALDMHTDSVSTELKRIEVEFARRARLAKRSVLQDYYYSQVLGGVSKILGSMNGRSALDIGCGDGTWLTVFRGLGASKLAGIELTDDRCAAASNNVPEAKLVRGSAHRLPWP